jgi:hypothetical protein
MLLESVRLGIFTWTLPLVAPVGTAKVDVKENIERVQVRS